MGKYKDIVYTLPEEREIMEQLTDITDSLVESVRVTHPQKYSNFIMEVQKLKHMNQELFLMIENTVSVELLCRLFSSQLNARAEKHLLALRNAPI